MIKKYLSVGTLILVSLICSYGQEKEEDPAKDLIEAVENLKAVAIQTVPLARSQFAIIEVKFKGDQYNDLVARIHTPTSLADFVILLNLDQFSSWVKQDEKPSVSVVVLSMASELRALDGVLLAEALAGSERETDLLYLYQKEEVMVFRVTEAYQRWVNKVHWSQ